ncbi:MAG: hypothetical protein O3B37_10500 [Proteobacteria bacterium]|nr:hypothetical protein [Pseudomonadota bacterium]
MTPGDTTIVAQETHLAFKGYGRDLLVRLGPGVDAVAFREALLIFLPRWAFWTRPTADMVDAAAVDIDVEHEKTHFRIAAVSWDGGYSIATDVNNAANALAGLLIDGILAHEMAFCSLHASAVEFDGAAILFAGPTEAGKSTLALRLAARGCRHLADDRVLLMRSDAPYRVGGLGLAAKARTPLPPGPELAALVDTRWYLTDDSIAYLHMEDDEVLGFGDIRPLGCVILPRRDPDLEFDAHLEPAPAGDIARTLIEEATSPVGAAVLVPAMGRLAGACQGYILHYRDGAAAAELLLSALPSKNDG